MSRKKSKNLASEMPPEKHAEYYLDLITEAGSRGAAGEIDGPDASINEVVKAWRKASLQRRPHHETDILDVPDPSDVLSSFAAGWNEGWLPRALEGDYQHSQARLDDSLRIIAYRYLDAVGSVYPALARLTAERRVSVEILAATFRDLNYGVASDFHRHCLRSGISDGESGERLAMSMVHAFESSALHQLITVSAAGAHREPEGARTEAAKGHPPTDYVKFLAVAHELSAANDVLQERIRTMIARVETFMKTGQASSTGTGARLPWLERGMSALMEREKRHAEDDVERRRVRGIANAILQLARPFPNDAMSEDHQRMIMSLPFVETTGSLDIEAALALGAALALISGANSPASDLIAGELAERASAASR